MLVFGKRAQNSIVIEAPSIRQPYANVTTACFRRPRNGALRGFRLVTKKRDVPTQCVQVVRMWFVAPMTRFAGAILHERATISPPVVVMAES